MKPINVAQPVMSRIVRFEKKRSFWWLGKFFIIFFVLSLSGIGIFWIAAKQIVQRQTLDLLTLFIQDREIIGEFWQDTLVIFWEELPQKKLIISAVLYISVVLFILLTRKSCMIVWKRMRQILRYKKEGL